MTAGECAVVIDADNAGDAGDAGDVVQGHVGKGREMWVEKMENVGKVDGQFTNGWNELETGWTKGCKVSMYGN